MDIIWILIAGVFMLTGIIGCLIPILPGPPLSFIGLLILQLQSRAPFTTNFLLVWLIIVVIITALDYFVSIYGAKGFGGTRYGLWGCAVGLIVGFWFGPVGIIAGPFIGALVGEWFGNRNSEQAIRSAIGSLVGFLVGTVIKLIACFAMGYYFALSFFN
ncbi:MAG TPA: DUF456 domain-containing protein [Cyclobacteriaceae bacterium]